MIGKGFDHLKSSLVPAYYKLGMWRVTHLQKLCCVCQIHQAIRIHAVLIPSKASNTALPTMSSKLYSLVCKSCHEDMTWLPPVSHLDIHPQISTVASHSKVHTLEVQSATHYASYIKAAMTAFKYKEDLSALPILVHAIQQLPRPIGSQPNNSVIVPMPTTHKRLAKRGFDPVTILSHYLSQHWQLPLWEGVDRVGDTRTQQGLTRIERLSNLDNAFASHYLPPVTNLILFDDVMTTGASLTALASTLMVSDERLELSAYTVAHGN